MADQNHIYIGANSGRLTAASFPLSELLGYF